MAPDALLVIPRLGAHNPSMPTDATDTALRAIAAERAGLAARRIAWPWAAARGALYAGAGAFLLTTAGFVLTNDPWFGAHAEVFCPAVCEDCSGPYQVRWGEDRSRDPGIECRRAGSLRARTPSEQRAELARPREEVGLTPVLLTGSLLWLALLLAVCVPLVIAVDVRDLRERRRDRERELDDREAELERSRREGPAR